MVVERSVEVPASADKVWAAIERPETLGQLMRGALGFRVDGGFPARWRVGDRLRLRPMLFHVLPLSRADIRVERLDAAVRVLETRERVGPIRRWRHRLTVSPIDDSRCRYTESVDARSGRSLRSCGWRYRCSFDRAVAAGTGLHALFDVATCLCTLRPLPNCRLQQATMSQRAAITASNR